jgi:hypothetical protein
VCDYERSFFNSVASVHIKQTQWERNQENNHNSLKKYLGLSEAPVAHTCHLKIHGRLKS